MTAKGCIYRETRSLRLRRFGLRVWGARTAVPRRSSQSARGGTGEAILLRFLMNLDYFALPSLSDSLIGRPGGQTVNGTHMRIGVSSFGPAPVPEISPRSTAARLLHRPHGTQGRQRLPDSGLLLW